MAACQWNNHDVVKLLLQKGAAVNVRNNLGKTALIIASERNNDEVVEVLKAAGAR
jgi:serine/threonine-protein phosphatase 6 regulatory ankyrin repeat subunit B